MDRLFPTYVIALAAALTLRHFYQKKHLRRKPQGFLGEVIYKLGKALLIIMIVCFGFVAAMLTAFIDEYYLFFSPSRCEKINEQTGIVMTEDVTPVKYKRFFGGPGEGPAYRLEVRTELDETGFMERCCSEECVICVERSCYKLGRKEFHIRKKQGKIIITH